MTIDCYVTLGEERETVYSAETLIRDLDKAGVEKAVIAPADREIAVLNKSGNDFIYNAALKFPDRLIPACTINPWYGVEGITELKRSAERGIQMLVLNPTVQGFLINDELVNDLIATAETYKLPVYVHTGPHLYGAPWQLTDCALRFPDVNFIMGHAGATDFWNDISHACSVTNNIYLEGSLARPFIFKAHIKGIGVERGIMGSAAPRNNLVFEWEQYRTELSDDEFLPVWGDVLASILPGKGGWK